MMWGSKISKWTILNERKNYSCAVEKDAFTEIEHIRIYRETWTSSKVEFFENMSKLITSKLKKK
jgi:hypothetical protein